MLWRLSPALFEHASLQVPGSSGNVSFLIHLSIGVCRHLVSMEMPNGSCDWYFGGQKEPLSAWRWVSRGYGATAARLTPDQKVGSSNLSALIFR